MYQLVYESTSGQFRYWFLLPLLIFLIALVILLVLKKPYDNRKSYFLKRILPLCIVFICVQYFAYTIHAAARYAYYEAYAAGNYLTTEGIVQNYHKPTDHAEPVEWFAVNGITFTTGIDSPDYTYRLTSVNGGAITGDGQKVRIGYIDADTFNYIVCLEVWQD